VDRRLRRRRGGARAATTVGGFSPQENPKAGPLTLVRHKIVGRLHSHRSGSEVRARRVTNTSPEWAARLRDAQARASARRIASSDAAVTAWVRALMRDLRYLSRAPYARCATAAWA
jgi:hypothetical protein